MFDIARKVSIGKILSTVDELIQSGLIPNCMFKFFLTSSLNEFWDEKKINHILSILIDFSYL